MQTDSSHFTWLLPDFVFWYLMGFIPHGFADTFTFLLRIYRSWGAPFHNIGNRVAFICCFPRPFTSSPGILKGYLKTPNPFNYGCASADGLGPIQIHLFIYFKGRAKMETLFCCKAVMEIFSTTTLFISQWE